jgi:hypothetical protein
MDHAERGVIVYRINGTFVWSSTGKRKALDLALGPPSASKGDEVAEKAGSGPAVDRPIRVGNLADVLVSCEAKAVMTEHAKSQPRVYDELSSSHEIVHQGRQDAIATGITVVNIANTFVSPLRQTDTASPLDVTKHKQPEAAAKMVAHLRGLPIRDAVGRVGFDAYATFLVDCDNQGQVRLWKNPPAPQLGDRDRYETFLQRVSQFYSERFGADS